MTEQPLKKADPELMKAIARESADLLENRAFTTAMRTLHLQCLGKLMADGLDPTQMVNLVAELRVLENLSRRLASTAHDADFAQGAPRARRTG
jgi:hypothetical protein